MIIAQTNDHYTMAAYHIGEAVHEFTCLKLGHKATHLE